MLGWKFAPQSTICAPNHLYFDVSLGTRLCYLLKSGVKNFQMVQWLWLHLPMQGVWGFYPWSGVKSPRASQPKKKKKHPKHKTKATNSTKALKTAHIKKMVLIEVFTHFVCEITEGEAKKEIWSSVNYLFFISTLWIYRRNQLIRQATLRLIFKPGHRPPPHHGLLTYGPSSPFRSFNHTIPCLMNWFLL